MEIFSFCALILQVYRVRIAKSTEGGIPYAAGKMEGGAYCRIMPQIRELTRQWDKNAHIDRQLYEKYDVKRGLRDATGRGVLTSLTRMAGWSAHRMEELGQGGRIIRPATKCVEKRRAYASMDER